VEDCAKRENKMLLGKGNLRDTGKKTFRKKWFQTCLEEQAY
jgi:hypothetical protein